MKNEQNPERQNPEIVISVGRLGNLTLNYNNTTIYTFNEPFDDVDHVYVRDGDSEAMYIFGNSEVVEALKDRLFPQRHQPKPEDTDIDMYVEWRLGQVDHDLRELVGEE